MANCMSRLSQKVNWVNPFGIETARIHANANGPLDDMKDDMKVGTRIDFISARR
jgi:hypothetical protein